MITKKVPGVFLLLLICLVGSLVWGGSEELVPLRGSRNAMAIRAFSPRDSVMIIPVQSCDGRITVEKFVVTRGQPTIRQRQGNLLPIGQNDLPVFSLLDESGKVLYQTAFGFPVARTVPLPMDGIRDGVPDVVPISDPEMYLVVPYYKEARFIDIYYPYENTPGFSSDLQILDGYYIKNPPRAEITGPSPVENISTTFATSNFYVLIIASGYTSGQMTTFNNRANNLKTYLLSKSPFSNYAANIVINKYGNTSSLGCYCGCAGIARLMCCNSTKVLNAAAASGYQYDEIIVLHNTSTYCGGGYRDNNNSYKGSSYNTYCMIYSGIYYKSMGLHEFGHSFGNLCDEYSYGSEGYDYYPCVNCRASCSDWSPISPTCQLGCDARTYYYRPDNSIMLTLSTEYFNNVSIQATYSPDGLNKRLDYFTNR